MAKYYRLLGEYDAETTTFSKFAGPAGSSPYTPDEGARLTGLRVVANRSAASTLCNHVNFKLTCNTFSPNSIECGGQGTGLQTAPALMGGQNAAMDWDIDQVVQAGVPITLEGKTVTVDTAVTQSFLLYGRFETSGR